MKVLILGAGYGTRLYPLTQDTPKPLIPINGKPMISFLIDKIDNLKKIFPIKETIIVSNNKFYTNFLDWRKQYNVDAEIINDGSTGHHNRRGAVRDIKFAMGSEKEDWLVLGGDNLFEDNLTGFMKGVYKSKLYPSVGVYDVKDKKEAQRFGVVYMNSEGRILKLEEKPQKPLTTLVAVCVYFFPAASLDFLDSFIGEERNVDTPGEYITYLVNKTKTFGYLLQGKWFDIGSHDS